MNKKLIGKRIRQQRTQLSLVREDFAEQVGISPQFLAEIENGKKGMSAETLYKICDRFGFSADYILLGRENLENINTPGAYILKNIPKIYMPIIEDVLKLFVETIEIKKEKGNRE